MKGLQAMKTTGMTVSVIVAFVSVGAALLVAGCSSTYQTRGAATASPFLQNPAQLRQGQRGEAKLIYVNPRADFGKYKKIQLEPVVLVAGGAKTTTFATMSRENQQAVVNYVDAQIREKLGRDYAFVTTAGPDVMRLRVAVTEAKGATVILDVASSVVPFMMAVSAVKRLATGTATGMGKAGAEMELLDSVSGERLAAAVDEQAGRKYTLRFDKFSRYRTVEGAFDFWTTRLQQRLAEWRAGKEEKQ